MRKRLKQFIFKTQKLEKKLQKAQSQYKKEISFWFMN